MWHHHKCIWNETAASLEWSNRHVSTWFEAQHEINDVSIVSLHLEDETERMMSRLDVQKASLEQYDAFETTFWLSLLYEVAKTNDRVPCETEREIEIVVMCEACTQDESEKCLQIRSLDLVDSCCTPCCRHEESSQTKTNELSSRPGVARVLQTKQNVLSRVSVNSRIQALIWIPILRSFLVLWCCCCVRVCCSVRESKRTLDNTIRLGLIRVKHCTFVCWSVCVFSEVIRKRL